MVHRDDLIKPTMEGFAEPPFAHPIPKHAPIFSAAPGTPSAHPPTPSHLPTVDESLNICEATELLIQQALVNNIHASNYRIGSRELALVNTKLEEALMWLRQGMVKIDAERKPSPPNPSK